ncbi:alpha-protein kinase 1-like [Teleopsis dalmanni]|uniref:alpha-protein kinase 1-like n=1 Tax=Teleopsis dalmanni TaxID=139649 RepID=UPI0018CE8DC9|nr:alpha-protein kinase 1-like [Teleopsis dalmanni]
MDLVKSNHSTQIQPDTSQVQNNATRQEKSLKDPSFLETITNITQISEKQLSASERNRRLIPYMAFYLPPSDIPINQAYAIQRPKQHTSNYQLPPTAADSAGPLPPPANIPIPTAYMHMKLPTVATAQQTDISQDYPNAGDVYHKIAYGSAHYPLPASLKNTGKKIPILHLLPPGHSAPAAPTLITYKHNSGPQRQKTVQYFPPLNTQTKTQPIQQEHQQLQLQQQQQQQQDHQEQQILYQPPVKQSKINLTPFTSSNTLPGHFIPIIYTPMNNANNNNDNNKNQQHNGNIINYNYADNKPTIEESPQIQQVEKQPHLDTHNQVEQHQQQQQHLQNVAELELLQSAPKHSPKASHSHSPPQQQHQQLQFITDTGLPALTSPQLPQSGVHQPVAVVHPTANSIYHIINEPTQSLSSVPQHQALIALKPLHQKQQQQQQKPNAFRIKQPLLHAPAYPHFHPPQPENFFNNEQSEHASHATPITTQQQQDYKYLNDENMTPQEKYVLYLQQRMRYNKQQQQQHLKQRERVKERERLREHDQYVKQYSQHTQAHTTAGPPTEQIFIIASSAAPVDVEPIEIQKQQVQHQQHQQRPLQHKLQNNYAATHNPATYPVIGTPHPSSKLAISAKQQHYSNAKPLYLPVPKFLSELEVVRQQQGHKEGQIQKLRQHSYNDGPSQSPYIDYIIEEPKQSLDEEQHGSIPTQQLKITAKPTSAPPQAAYIVITTALPPATPTSAEYYGSTVRPAYKKQPTIRLQAVAQEDQQKNYPTRRPTIIAPQLSNTAYSNKPNYNYVSSTSRVFSFAFVTDLERTKPDELYKLWDRKFYSVIKAEQQ